MPKIKTNRAVAKRFKKTGTGKLKRNKAYKSQPYRGDRYNIYDIWQIQSQLYKFLSDYIFI